MIRITPARKVAPARFQVLTTATLIVATLILAHCGGGGGGGGSVPPPLSADFTLTVQPASVSVPQGSSGSVTVSITGVNGFSSQVSVVVAGMPSGVTASPAQFSLASGGQQAVTLSASSTAAVANTPLTVTGTSGSLTHAGTLALGVVVPPDFTLTIQPTSVSLSAGSSALVSVSLTGLNGFAAQASVTITGMPAGLTPSPSEFNLSAGSPEIVTLSAESTTTLGSSTLTVTATSGSLDHSGQIALTVIYPQPSVYPPMRTRYVRTDSQGGIGFLYEPVTKRFFISNTYLNRIDVFDATTELKVGEISVPEPWVGDETPDHTKIYMGTQIGDVYEIDPVAMEVTKRFPALQIGPSGFAAYEAHVMADGNLALLGGQGGIPSVDGYGYFAIWNPADNAFQAYIAQSGTGTYWGTVAAEPAGCVRMGNIGQFTLSADRTKILLGSIFSDNTLCSFDPSTLDARYVEVPSVSIGLRSVLVPPDGNEIIAPSGMTVTIYDSTGLYQTDQFQLSGGGSGAFTFILSSDGSTLYVVDGLWGGISAYKWKTHQQTGWLSDFAVADLPETVSPMAVDPTGLIVGSIGDGVAFLDGSVLQPAQPQFFAYTFSNVLKPGTGAVQGGTSTLIQISIAKNLGKVYFGGQLASGDSNSSSGVQAIAPAGSPGPADVAVSTTDGGLLMAPEGFSYGPSIVETITTASTAEGGGTGILWGYGFGPAGEGTTASGLSVSVGGHGAAITNYSGQPPDNYLPYPFPIESVEFTLPPGTAGTTADITVTSMSGSTTAKGVLQYLPATQQFPLAGASLYQGVYDSGRDLYYFTDQTKIQVFSKTQGAWLAPISIKGASRLWGIALSPNGSRLAVTDAGNGVVDVLNPSSPSAVSAFPLTTTPVSSGIYPCGVAITDSGIVYYLTFDVDADGGSALHKLNTTTGVITNYQYPADLDFKEDAYFRVLLSNDNSRLYGNEPGGTVFALDMATDTLYTNPIIYSGDYELALSSNGTWMTGAEYLIDTNLNLESGVALTGREMWNQTAIYGEKLSPDGNLLFIPLTNAIDVIDGKRGTLLKSIALPFALSANYDALVSDGIDNVLVAITGEAGDGIAVIDLTSLPEPLPLPYASVATSNLKSLSQSNFAKTTKSSPDQAAKVGAATPNRHPRRIPHRMNPLTLPVRIR